ncbi:MAG: glucose-6-phosphate isomerase [Actinomycetes bacterium]
MQTRGVALRGPSDTALTRLVADGVAQALAAKDPGLWGPEAEAEAAARLGWLDLPHESRALLPRLAALVEGARADGLDHIVLCGMGGSSLAPEVITRTAGVELTVLDTTDPSSVRRALNDRLGQTLVVVASKSGSTVETDSHRRAYRQAFRDADLSEAEVARRFVAVTDPGSPLAALAEEQGWREVVLAHPDVGGRYSALSAFGLVPSALAGVDVEALLDEAAALSPALDGDADNPGLVLGAALGGAAEAGRDKLVLADAGSGIAGFGDWAEQLVAESTGKQGRGILPVVVESPDEAADAPDRHVVLLGGDAPPEGTAVDGPLGGQLLLWEYATAVAGRVLGINPFDQPNVTESKDNTNALLTRAHDEGGLAEPDPLLVDGDVEVHAEATLLGGATDLAGALDALLAAVPDRGYLAVMAYLDRRAEHRAAVLRPALARRTDRVVTFGWGPRFLHSTGQYHKGGPQVGAFCQVTGAVTDDLLVPGRPYTFGTLQAAQAAGDLAALTGRGRPAVRLHLRHREQGLAQLLRVLGVPDDDEARA